MKEKGIILKVYLQDDKCFVNTDEDKIIQVVTNLLDNSIKYCEDNGIITCRVYYKNNKVLVEIYNNGPKLSEEEKYIYGIDFINLINQELIKSAQA